jgi:hypothetical protein
MGLSCITPAFTVDGVGVGNNGIDGSLLSVLIDNELNNVSDKSI